MSKLHEMFAIHTVGIFFAALAICLSGCSSTPEKQNPSGAGTDSLPVTTAKSAAETETGRVAFQRAYVAARAWAADAQPISLESQPTKQSNGQDGKAAVWRGTFGSASRQSMKSWSWSGVDADDAPPRGTNPGSADTWNPSNVSSRTFDFQFLKVDSDQAFKTAQEHGGKAALKASSDAQVRYSLHWAPRQNELDWTVSIVGTKPITVTVNGTSGVFVHAEK